jgi:hypothetical protein
MDAYAEARECFRFSAVLAARAAATADRSERDVIEQLATHYRMLSLDWTLVARSERSL